VINTLHENGIKVILDGVLNHVSRAFFAFKDLQINVRSSHFKNWFKGVDFDKHSPEGDPFSYEGWSGHYNLVKLQLTNPEVENHLLSAVGHWIQEFDIDGLRLDAADVMDFGFLKKLTQFTRSQKEDFWLMGEVVHGDYTKWANSEMLHATTNYECYKGLYSSHNDKNYFELAHSLQRLFNTENGLYKDLQLYNFADNHDVNRVASRLNDSAHLFPLNILLYTMPGIPSVYYGSEWGLEGEKNKASDRALRPNLNRNELNQDKASDLKDCLKRLAQVREQSLALKNGGYEQIHVASEQLVFKRSNDKETIIIAVNASTETVSVDIPVSGMGLKDILNQNKSFPALNNKVTIDIPGSWGRVMKVTHNETIG